MNALEFKEWFDNVQSVTQYKYVSLDSPKGQNIVAWNNARTKLPERIKEIELRLKSLPAGIYILKCKNTQGNKALADEYPVNAHGKIVQTETTEKKPTMSKENPSVISYDSALKFQVRIKELELENDDLKKRNKELEEEIDELQNELDELETNAPNLAENQSNVLDNIGKWINDTLTTVSPMIDKHFELKEKALNIQFLQATQQRPPAQMQPPQQQKTPVQDGAVNYTIEKIKQYIINADNQDLADCFNSAESLDHFYNMVREYDENIFNELVTFINTK